MIRERFARHASEAHIARESRPDYPDGITTNWALRTALVSNCLLGASINLSIEVAFANGIAPVICENLDTQSILP